MKPKFYAIPAALIAACLIFAVIVHFSYTDESEKVYDYAYESDGSLTDLLKESKINAPEDVANQAELVVEAKYTGNRKITGDAFYSQMNISHVYKGEQALAGKEVYVIESMSVFTKTHYINAGNSFVIPLQPGEKYLLLLKHKQFDPKRKLDDFQTSQYYPVTQGAFGCYRLSSENQTKLIDSNKTYTIRSLKAFDVFTNNQKTLDTYNQYKAYMKKRFPVDRVTG